MSVEYLKLSDPMYDEIENAVRRTYEHSCIVWIEKIKNEQLENEFKAYVSTLNTPNIKRLFHGTSEDIARIIIQEGFDPSKNKTSAHGLGVYFSTRAAYSKDYCHRTKGREYVFMLVCDVATGKVCQGRNCKPIPHEFDSATDSLARPDMYIVNKRQAALPLYLVAFYPKV
jgi:hypothetical protein